MGQWINLQTQKGLLQSNWNSSRDNLDQRMNLLDVEQKKLKEIVSQRTQATTEVDQRRLTLLQTQEKLEQEQQALTSQLNAYIQRAQALHIRLPPPLHVQWNEKFASLSDTNRTSSERLETLLSLFKQFDEFNRRVALHIGAMDIPDANHQPQATLTNQIYLGVSQGWYVNDDGTSFGYGRPTPTGWKWWHGKEAQQELGKPLDAAAVKRVLSVLQNPTNADYVSLPVKITR
jgi:hypothetical protein